MPHTPVLSPSCLACPFPIPPAVLETNTGACPPSLRPVCLPVPIVRPSYLPILHPTSSPPLRKYQYVFFFLSLSSTSAFFDIPIPGTRKHTPYPTFHSCLPTLDSRRSEDCECLEWHHGHPRPPSRSLPLVSRLAIFWSLLRLLVTVQLSQSLQVIRVDQSIHCTPSDCQSKSAYYHVCIRSRASRLGLIPTVQLLDFSLLWSIQPIHRFRLVCLY